MKRLVLPAMIAFDICALVFMAQRVSAQSWGQPQSAYTSADPVRSDALGLALPSGRWAISRADTCDALDLHPGENVIYWPLEGYSSAGTLGVIDSQGVVRLCDIRLERLMDTTPCFTNAADECDIAAEQ